MEYWSMLAWREVLSDLSRSISIYGERSSDHLPDDDGEPSLDISTGPPDDESERIVEEAIRRIEEAEHEWSRSWEPETKSD